MAIFFGKPFRGGLITSLEFELLGMGIYDFGDSILTVLQRGRLFQLFVYSSYELTSL